MFSSYISYLPTLYRLLYGYTVISFLLYTTIQSNSNINQNIINSNTITDTIISNSHNDNNRLSKVLVLDIDGTLYDDDCLIENQIKNSCHIFSKSFGYDIIQSEIFHRKYGSTIRGICENGQPKVTFLDYYNNVYPFMDMSLLKKYSSNNYIGKN